MIKFRFQVHLTVRPRLASIGVSMPGTARPAFVRAFFFEPENFFAFKF